MNSIKLNDILGLTDVKDVKIRFNLMFNENWNPIELFQNGDLSTMMAGQYWNYNKSKSYKTGQITIGFVKIKPNEDFWLLFHVGRVTKDLNKFNGVGYEYENLEPYQKYVGRLIIQFKNRAQTMIRNAISVMDDCHVLQILPNSFDQDIFPGYEHVHVSWDEMKRVLEKENWKTALQNQKGVYLITDTSNGKMYIGAAYGNQMLLGRWKAYIKNGHGGNQGLKQLSFDYIKQHFRYSILDIYKSTTHDQIILDRENWWKSVLQSRIYGYNEN